jgi:hypothetical protein
MDQEETLPPVKAARTPPVKVARTQMERLYDSAVRPIVDAHTDAGVRDQVAAAFAKPPATPDEVDAWFERHFHKPPVSHDTTLFNQLQAIRAAARDAAGQDTG